MKKVRIINGKIGLVYKNGNYTKTLNSGNYWLFLNEKVFIYDVASELFPPSNVDLLLENIDLANKLNVITVLDNEIYLKYENDIFKGVLTAGRYLFWKENKVLKFEKADLSKVEITENISKTVLKKVALLNFIRVYVVASFEKAILFIDGRQKEVLKSGVYYFWKNTIDIKIEKVDLRQIQLEVSGQEMLTKDKAVLRINFFAQYKVNDIVKALVDNKNFEKQLYILIQLVLREYIGVYTLDELLENKESVADKVTKTIAKKANSLGVTILDAGIKDIILTGEMKDIMNQVLIAQKKAQANVIYRREETAATRSLLNTAKLMDENEMLFKLKEMEYVEKIADKIGEITVSGNGNVVEQLKTIFSK